MKSESRQIIAGQTALGDAPKQHPAQPNQNCSVIVSIATSGLTVAHRRRALLQWCAAACACDQCRMCQRLHKFLRRMFYRDCAQLCVFAMPPLTMPKSGRVTATVSATSCEQKQEKVSQQKPKATIHKDHRQQPPPRKPTPSTKPAPKQQKKKPKKGLWWCEAEITMMLDVVQHIKPCGGYMWDQVCEKYNSKQERDFRGLSDIPYRDVDAIRTKWKCLKNCKKPHRRARLPPQRRQSEENRS
jgi:hypothetical protein